MRDGLEEAARTGGRLPAGAEVLVGEDLRDAEDVHRRDARRLESLGGLLLRMPAGPGGDDPVEGVLVAVAADHVGEAGGGGELRLTGSTAKRVELSVVLAGD